MKSDLVTYTKLSPNNSGKRKYAVTRITPHCVVGQASVETLGSIFAKTSRQASSNYGIGADGRVGMYVEEQNRSWCSSNADNDNRAITIECASDATAPYAFNDTVYNRLIELCTDICKRYGKTKLLWLGDKDKTLAYTPKDDEMILTVHRWFANKSCPGAWLMARMSELANSVTNALQAETTTQEVVEETDTDILYRVQVGAYRSKTNAESQLAKIKAAGVSGIVVQVDSLYKVQVGAFRVKENAENMVEKLAKLGIQGFIVTAKNTKDDKADDDAEDESIIKVGSKVTINKGAKTYTGGTLAGFAFTRTYVVSQIKGDRAVVTYQGVVTAAVHLSDLTLAE